MSPPSNSSSMEPHNGSANSNGRQSPRTNARSSRSRHEGSTRRPGRNNRTRQGNVSRGVNHLGSHVNGAGYDSAYTYAMSPASEHSGTTPSDADYYGSQQYYASTQFHTNETTLYDNEVRLDEELPHTAPPQNQQHHYPHTPVQGYYQSRTPVGTSSQNVPTSPTIERWTGEYSPEERIRLGLPRYATEEEIEEQRRIYDQNTQQADASEPAPHAG